jgi:small-conductance mechanosensitive channel
VSYKVFHFIFSATKKATACNLKQSFWDHIFKCFFHDFILFAILCLILFCFIVVCVYILLLFTLFCLFFIRFASIFFSSLYLFFVRNYNLNFANFTKRETKPSISLFCNKVFTSRFDTERKEVAVIYADCHAVLKIASVLSYISVMSIALII